MKLFGINLAFVLLLVSNLAFGQTLNNTNPNDSIIVFIKGEDCIKVNSYFFNELKELANASNVGYCTNLTKEEMALVLPAQMKDLNWSETMKFSVEKGFGSSGLYNKEGRYIGQSMYQAFEKGYYLHLKEDFFKQKFQLSTSIFTKGTSFVYDASGFTWFTSPLNSVSRLNLDTKKLDVFKPDTNDLWKFYTKADYLELKKYDYALRQFGMHIPIIEAVSHADSALVLFIGTPKFTMRNNKLQLGKTGHIVRLFNSYSDTLKMPESFILEGKEYYIDPVAGFPIYKSKYFFVAESRGSNKAKIFSCSLNERSKQFVDFQKLDAPAVKLEMKDINEDFVNIDNRYILNKQTGTYVKLPKDFKLKNWNVESVFKTGNSLSVILKSENKVKVVVQAFNGEVFSGKVFVSNYTFTFLTGPFLVTHTTKGKMAVFNKSEIWY